MTAKWEKKGANDGELTFEIGPDKIKEGLDKAFQKNKKKINVPGFRKGKVSRQVFNEMYGEEALYQDALNILLPDAYEQAIKETNIEPVAQPQVSVDSLEKGKPWVLKAVVTVKPAVELGEYKGVEVTKPDTAIHENEVEDAIEKKRQSQAELVLVDRPAKKGDTVTIDFDGYVDGEAFDGGKANNYALKLGSNSFIDNFEDQIEGHKAGDEFDVNVTFPEDYQAKELAGKAATFKIKLHEVKEEQLPALDDEFAKDVDEEVDSLDELKKKVKQQLKDEKTEHAESELEDEAINAAVDNAEVKEIPEAMIDEDTQRQMDQYLANMQQQGINAQTYFKLTGSKPEDLKKQFADGASRRVKTNLVLEAIVEKEGIKPSEDDVTEEVKDLAKQYGMNEDAIRGALTEDMLKHDIAIQKAVKLIVDNAKQVAKSDQTKKDDK